ncbi:MAG TPA: 4-amino-4-deoxy-L-arabinose transferase [Nocardioidaceae bacterium]|nr:4-amino-4-deoxy-L-arabinose transferase [Nocardioidaceae bacterium]
MPSPGPVDQIVELTVDRPARCGLTKVVSIDGPAGSGKTTLSALLAGAVGARGLSVAELHMDDFYDDWDGLGPDLEPRLLTQVFEPLADEQSGRWQRYDWHATAFDGWVDLPVVDVLVLEGCGSGAQAYDRYRGALVWVEADRETRVARGIERDGEQVLPQWLAWMEREEAHFRLNATRERADVVVATG